MSSAFEATARRRPSCNWIEGGCKASIVASVSTRIPRATVARLPRYLRYLEQQPASSLVVSDEIAEGCGTSAAQVRKDLSYLGTVGTRGVGYNVAGLKDLIMRELGLAEDLRVAIIGAGNLGRALANYGGFAERRFQVVALYDIEPRVIGRVVAGMAVRDLDVFAVYASRQPYAISIIATPVDAAQSVADLMVASGVRSILNFAPTMLKVPSHVTVRQVDLAVELQILAYYLKKRW